MVLLVREAFEGRRVKRSLFALEFAANRVVRDKRFTRTRRALTNTLMRWSTASMASS